MTDGPEPLKSIVGIKKSLGSLITHLNNAGKPSYNTDTINLVVSSFGSR